MIRQAATAAALLALAGCATAPPAPRTPAERALGAHAKRALADPGKVVGTEIAFARMAQDEGLWTAFREYAAEDAVMFMPQATSAQTWLKGRNDPPEPIRWQPHQVWSSCDGSLAVSTGAAQYPDGSHGYFVTVWKRQADGAYRWIMDTGGTLDEPWEAPEFIDAQVASCDPLAPMAATVDEAGGTSYAYASNDRTLRAGVRLDPWCGRIVTASVFRGNESDEDPPGAKRGSEQVLYRAVPPPPLAAGEAAPPRACEA